MLMRKMLVLAKKQTAKGTAATPTPGANAIMTRTQMPTIISGEFVKRTLVKGYKGNDASLMVGEHRVFEFETECASSGAAGTAPPTAPLIMGCGFNETLTPATSAVYNLISDMVDYYTLWCYLDKVLFKITDAQGSMSFTGDSKTIPVMKFRYMGAYEAMTDVNMPSGAVFTAFQKPKTIGKVNTPTFTIGATAVKTSSFGWDLANELGWRDLMNEQGVDSPDRTPKANATFELSTVATKAWGEACRLGTELPLSMVHGTTAGHIVELAMPKLTFSAEPSIQEVGKRAFLGGQFDVLPNAGDDEIVLTFR
jgi:hypothetical protein